jgi:type IV pilus assembly protein PilX
MNSCLRAPRRLPARQHGIVLVIALIVLVAMTLAGVALVRSVETGNMVAGNLAFKQGATLAGDAAVEGAIAWLEPLSSASAIYKDDANAGYYATSQDLLDRTGQRNDPVRALVDWDNNNCNELPNSNCIRPSAAVAVGDNSVSYIIHRLCKYEGDPNDSSNSCVSYESKITGSSKRGEIKAGEDKRFSALPVPYYRITSRIKGPRNTVSFVETMVHF